MPDPASLSEEGRNLVVGLKSIAGSWERLAQILYAVDGWEISMWTLRRWGIEERGMKLEDLDRLRQLEGKVGKRASAK